MYITETTPHVCDAESVGSAGCRGHYCDQVSPGITTLIFRIQAYIYSGFKSTCIMDTSSRVAKIQVLGYLVLGSTHIKDFGLGALNIQDKDTRK